MELLLQPFKVKGIYVDFVAEPLPPVDESKLQGLPRDHPGGIEGLLPPLTQLVQLLVTEAKVQSAFLSTCQLVTRRRIKFRYFLVHLFGGCSSRSSLDDQTLHWAFFLVFLSMPQ